MQKSKLRSSQLFFWRLWDISKNLVDTYTSKLSTLYIYLRSKIHFSPGMSDISFHLSQFSPVSIGYIGTSSIIFPWVISHFMGSHGFEAMESPPTPEPTNVRKLSILVISTCTFDKHEVGGQHQPVWQGDVTKFESCSNIIIGINIGIRYCILHKFRTAGKVSKTNVG